MSDYEIYDEKTYRTFHTGSLHGLDPDQRRLRQESCAYESHRRLLAPPRREDHRFVSLSECKASPGAALSEVLRTLTVYMMHNIARRTGIQLPSGLRKLELVNRMASQLPQHTDWLEKRAHTLDDESFHVLCKLLTDGDVLAEQAPAYVSADLSPFVYLCRREGIPVYSMPPELRSVLAGLDIQAIDKWRLANKDVDRLLHNFTTLGGVARIADLYDTFRELDSARIFDKTQFFEEVRQRTEYCNAPFIQWEHDGESFVTSACLKDSQITGNALASRHADIIPRAASDFFITGSVEDYVYALDSVRQLTSYFDDHIPDHESELFFADEMVDSLIGDFMFGRASLETVLRRLTRSGWYLAEGTNAAPKLTHLVCKLYREIPRWEFNGWSEQEFTDMQGLPCLVGESLHLGLTGVDKSEPEDYGYQDDFDSGPSCDTDMPYELDLAS